MWPLVQGDTPTTLSVRGGTGDKQGMVDTKGLEQPPDQLLTFLLTQLKKTYFKDGRQDGDTLYRWYFCPQILGICP